MKIYKYIYIYILILVYILLPTQVYTDSINYKKKIKIEFKVYFINKSSLNIIIYYILSYK